jgi:Ca2+-binding EF-hand superfamily protein
MADLDQIGYLGHRQFADLLGILKIETTEEILQNMFVEMDENDDVSKRIQQLSAGFVSAMLLLLCTLTLFLNLRVNTGSD